jgi:hypothetical protein
MQTRFAIDHGPAYFLDKKSLINIMTACVILHNMIIEDERDLSLEFFFDSVGSRVRPERNPDRIHAFLETYRQIKTRPHILNCKMISSRTIANFTRKSDALIIHSFNFLFMYVWEKQLFASEPFIICLIICF